MGYTNYILLIVFVGILLGYLFGSLSWSIIIGKLFFKKDPRDFESQNAGATNSCRIYGKKVGLIVLMLDILKGVIPTIVVWVIAKYAMYIDVYISDAFNPYSLCFLAGMMGIVGHCYPIFFKFKGGKGAATFGAFLISLIPFGGLLQLIILILLVATLHYVSLSVLISSVMSWIWLFIPGINYSFILDTNIHNIYYAHGSIYWLLLVWAMLFLSTCLVWFKHRKNIISLIHKEERKYFFH